MIFSYLQLYYFLYECRKCCSLYVFKGCLQGKQLILTFYSLKYFYLIQRELVQIFFSWLFLNIKYFLNYHYHLSRSVKFFKSTILSELGLLDFAKSQTIKYLIRVTMLDKMKHIFIWTINNKLVWNIQVRVNTELYNNLFT